MRIRKPLFPGYGDDDYLAQWQLKQLRALYAGEATMADRWLGNFLEKAHDLGVFRKTASLRGADP